MYYYPFSCILKPILKGWKTFLVVINLMEELVELGFTSRQKLEIKMMADFLSYLNSSKHLSKAYTILFITKNWKFFHILIKSLCWDKRGKYQYILYADDIHSFLMFLFCLPKTNKMHANIQISIAVNPSAFGEFVVMLLKMLISTRNKVISKAIRPKNQTSLFVNI